MYTVYDAHVHIYPEKIAAKATCAIGDFYNRPMKYVGDVGNLLEKGKQAGISRYLVHSVATTPKQVVSINDFIIRECGLHPEFIGFGTLHHAFENTGEELKRIQAAGLHGVKLHPDFQKFEISDKCMDETYAALAELGMPVLFHVGDSRYTWSSPAHIPIIRRRHPQLKIICAHYGGYSQWDVAEQCLKGLDVYVDTSSSAFKLDNGQIKHMINLYGTDRVMFGSDYPMWNAKDEINRLLELNLTPSVYEKIFSGNLIELLQL